ncbi:MAG: DUF362 domain-containing protein [Desulfobacterales bacterium]|jgi:uncharacterized protein (DUF362 family)
MNEKSFLKKVSESWTRREFLSALVAGGVTAAAGLMFFKYFKKREPKTETFIASVTDYKKELKQFILKGFKELNITSALLAGKRVLLKPNLVEPQAEASHVNTHPMVVRAAVEAFLHHGAAEVLVAEGAGHRRDSLLVLEDSGLADVLYEDKIPFIDLNSGPVIKVKNLGGRSKLGDLILPQEILHADIVVSLAKMKTHHWAGVTLSMKNMFGIMPGIVYGWPKNVLHWAGIHESIFDINATLKTHFAIVDGIVGMQGDGPIMGTPVQSKVLIMGRNLPAVDATCARVMGIDPQKIPYLKLASGRLGAISDSNIIQRGENIASVRRDFQLLDFIPAHRGIRLGSSQKQILPADKPLESIEFSG